MRVVIAGGTELTKKRACVMHTFEANLGLLSAQRHAEVALSLAQAANLKVDVSAPDRVPTAVRPVSWSETASDWLDTTADHCSPLDDY